MNLINKLCIAKITFKIILSLLFFSNSYSAFPEGPNNKNFTISCEGISQGNHTLPSRKYTETIPFYQDMSISIWNSDDNKKKNHTITN